MLLNRATICLISLLSVTVISGCSPAKPVEKVIATVNGEPIYLKELQRELSIKVRQDPSLDVSADTMLDLTDTLIKRKVMVQGAMDKKMAEEPGFVDTIKSFWEQTLVKNFIEYKHAEFERLVFVTDGEIEAYYAELKKASADMAPLEEVKPRLKEWIKLNKLSVLLEEWLEKEKKGADINVNKKLIFEQAS